MRKLGLLGIYLFIALLITFLASDFSLGYSNYCYRFGYRYMALGFDCSNHVNSFLAAYLGRPQTYFFTISLLLMMILFFRHIPYLKPEYWVRVASNPIWFVAKKILAISLEVMVVFYSLFVIAGLIQGFSFAWEIKLLFYPVFLWAFSSLVVTFYHLVYVLTKKYIIALFVFFFTNLIFFVMIDQIAWSTFADDTFVINFSVFYTMLMLVTSAITLAIALRHKECYQ